MAIDLLNLACSKIRHRPVEEKWEAANLESRDHVKLAKRIDLRLWLQHESISVFPEAIYSGDSLRKVAKVGTYFYALYA